MNNPASHNTYRVAWSAEDGEYVALCAELPSLSWLAATQEKALRGVIQAATEVVADLQKSGEPVPRPIADRKYSGKFMVRVPPEVHRHLALEAVENGVSLNRLAAARLAAG